MGSVEEKTKPEGIVNGARANLLEEMKLLKEFQDQSGMFHVTEILVSYKSLTFYNLYRSWAEVIR